MTEKFRGLIFYSKNIKDNDLFVKILSYNDGIQSGIVYGGNSSKKKLIYQNGYFIDYIITQKNTNYPPIITGETSQPLIGYIINDKYKSSALLSILSLINLSIVEGQYVKGIYKSVYDLIVNITDKDHWILYYCKWLFKLLQIIGYQIDYIKNYEKKYFDIMNQEFTDKSNNYSIFFPHDLFDNYKNVNYKNINTIFLIFESIFIKNHLDNISYKMPIHFINFKTIILNQLMK